MKTNLFGVILAGGGLLAVLAGCASQGKTPATPAADTDAAAAKPSGAKLWAQNCIRCHNSRSPTEYSNAQWDVALLHMRVRANLTAEDSRAIREFLQTAN